MDSRDARRHFGQITRVTNLAICCLLLTQVAPAGEPVTLLQYIQEHQRHEHMADLSTLGDGALYVTAIGGFGGHLYEFADLKDNDRVSLTVGFAQNGEPFCQKRLMYPFNPSYGDASIVELRAAIRNLIAAKLPQEVEHVSGDDSMVILVAEIGRAHV